MKALPMGGDPNGSPLVFLTSLIFFNSECNEEFVKEVNASRM